MAQTIYVPQADEFIDFSDTASDAEIQAWIRAKYPKPAPTPPPAPPAPPEEEVGAFESGFYGSLGRLEAAGGKTAQAAGLGSLADYLFGQSRESSEYAAKYKPDVADISKIGGVGGVAKFAGSTIAQSLPETAAGIGGALIGAQVGTLGGPAAPITIPLGALIGSAITSLPFFVGGNLQRQAEEQNIPLEETSGAAATTGAIAQAPLDAAFDMLVARKLPGSGIAYDVAKKTFLKEVATTAATEGLTEPAQQAIELAQANPTKLLEFGSSVQQELLNAAAGGVLAGGIIGGAAEGVGRVLAPAQTPEQIKAKAELGQDLGAERLQSREMERMSEINNAIQQLSLQPTIGQLKLKKITIQPTRKNKLNQPIDRFQLTDAKGKQIAEFSDPVNAVDAVNKYQNIAKKRITIQSADTNNVVPTETVKPGTIKPVEPTAGLETGQPISVSGGLSDIAVQPVEGPAIKPVEAPSIEAPAQPEVEPIQLKTEPIAEPSLDEAKRIQASSGSGVALQYPTYKSFLEENRKTGFPDEEIATVTGIKNEEDFLQVREEEIQQYVEPPAQNAVRRVYEKGGSPFSSNAFGPGRRGVEYIASDGSTQFEPLSSEPISTAPVTATETPAEEVIGVSNREADTALVDAQIISPEEQAQIRARLNEKVDKIASGVRDRLDKYGLKNAQVNFIPAFVDGLRFRATMGEQTMRGKKSIITIATGIYDPDLTVEQMTDKVFEVLDHESIHSLVSLGLIRQNEMNMLFRAAEDTKVPGKSYTYLDRAKAVYEPLARRNKVYQDPDAIREEAVAEMFRDWRLKKLGAPQNTRGLINRVIESVRSMFSNMRANDYADMFQQIESGVIGAGEPIAEPTRKMNSKDLRVMAKPQLPNLALAPEYPYEQRVPEVNAEQINDAVARASYGAGVDLVMRVFKSRTFRALGLTKFSPSEDKVVSFFQNFADKMLPLGMMIDYIKKNGGTVPDAFDAYMQEDLMRSTVGEDLRQREEGSYKNLVDFIKNNKIDWDDFELYLYARHAEERNKVIKARNPKAPPELGSGISTKDAKDLLEDFFSRPDYSLYEEAERMVREIIDDTNALRVQSGLEPLYKSIIVPDGEGNLVSVEPYKNYVPLRGFAEESPVEGEVTEEIRARTGQGFRIRGREDKRALGRVSRASDIIAHVMLQNTEAVIRAAKNKVGLSFLQLIEANPELSEDFGAYVMTANKKPLKKYLSPEGIVKTMIDPMYKNSDDVMVVKRDGIEIPIKITNRFLQKALLAKSSSTFDGASKAITTLQKINRFLGGMRTAWNPEFMLINFPRDLQTAMLALSQYEIDGVKTAILKDSARAIKSVYKILRNPEEQNEWSKWFDDFRKDGGYINGFYGMTTLEDRMSEIERLIQDPSGSLQGRTMSTIRNVAGWLEDMNGAFENAIRLSVYKNLIDIGGVPRQRAAQVAKNLTVNFDKRGSYGPVLNSLYLFFNASMQGTWGLMIAAGRSKKVRRAFGGLIIMGMLQDILNSMFSDEDEGGKKLYDKLPSYVLENNIVIMDPTGTFPKGYIAIPLQYGLNAFYNAGRAMGRTMRGEYKSSEAAESIGSVLFDAINPIGGTETFINFVAPTVLDPFINLVVNVDAFGKKISPEPFPGSVPKADSQTYWSSTSPIFKTVAEYLNTFTGGTEYTSGMVDIRPDTLEYMSDFILGGVGATARRLYDTATGTIPAVLSADYANIEMNNVPLFRKLVGNISERVTFEDYFQKVNHVLARGEELKSAIKEGDPDRIKSVRTRFAGELKIYPAVRAISNKRNQLAADLRKLRENEKIPPEQKRRRIDALQRQIEAITGRVGKLYEENIDNKYPDFLS